MSDLVGYGPDEGSEAQFGFLQIELTQTLQEWLLAVVFDKRDYRLCERRPCVGAIMGISRLASSSLHFSESRESTAGGAGEGIDDSLVVSLIV